MKDFNAAFYLAVVLISKQDYFISELLFWMHFMDQVFLSDFWLLQIECLFIPCNKMLRRLHNFVTEISSLW